MDDNIAIHIWDGEQQAIAAYAELLTLVFKKSITPAHMAWKHLHNPLGPSYIAYAENDKGEMVAARAFWRMYSERGEWLQPCDTVTRPDFQRRGLFRRLTQACLDATPTSMAIMNFPNNNSFPAYLKMGWQLHCENRKTFSVYTGIGQRKITDIERDLKSDISEKALSYWQWRFSPDSGRGYRLARTNTHFIIDNGTQSGGVCLVDSQQPFYAGAGKSNGYAAPNHFNSHVKMRGAAISLACHSRTAILLREPTNLSTIDACLAKHQINVLMDTF